VAAAREAEVLLRQLREKLLDPPPATPEGEAAALLLYLGLPTTAILGSPQPIESAPRSDWVWWVWGKYPSKRALIPSVYASRLVELYDILKAKHRSRRALLRSLQYQAAKWGIRWSVVRRVWQAYLGRGPLAEVEQLKRRLAAL
jgi:hypothetical protein